jgi:DNA-binding transcriptional ArsR family regulator
MSVDGTAMKVELDKRSLFALASDTRLEILKNLQSNRRTVTQLAELLRIDKAAVHRHLKKLEEGGFVARTEDHGFVYYALTWKSRDILDPNDRTRIVILISSALICLTAVIVLALVASGPAGHFSDGGDKSSEAQSGSDGIVNTPSAASGIDMTVPALVLIACAAGLAGLAWRLYRRPRQRGGETASDAFCDGIPQGAGCIIRGKD